MYTDTTLDNSSSRTCIQCGSKLILINKVTEKLEGSLFPQTSYTFRCTNKECQDRREEEIKKRLKASNDRIEAEKRKLDERQLKRRSIISKLHL